MIKNKDLLKVVNIALYFINEGKISAKNFKKLKYLLYFVCMDYYEKHQKKLLEIEFWLNKKKDIVIKIK